MNAWKAASVVAVLILSSVPVGAQESVPFATVAAGNRSSISAPRQVVIRKASEWEKLWEQHTAGLGQEVRVPIVDFSRDIVIAVFFGKLDLGSQASIVRVVRETGRLSVLINVVSPPLPTEATVTPFHMVRLGRSDLPVDFLRLMRPQPICHNRCR